MSVMSFSYGWAACTWHICAPSSWIMYSNNTTSFIKVCDCNQLHLKMKKIEGVNCHNNFCRNSEERCSLKVIFYKNNLINSKTLYWRMWPCHTNDINWRYYPFHGWPTATPQLRCVTVLHPPAQKLRCYCIAVSHKSLMHCN